MQPDDYIMNELTHTFTSSSPVDVMVCLTITIEDDSLSEGNEMFTVSLELMVTPTFFFPIGTTAVTIVDNEGQLNSIIFSIF